MSCVWLSGIERPACDAKRRAQLIRTTAAPERHADALIYGLDVEFR
jgi:hypothetical protein